MVERNTELAVATLEDPMQVEYVLDPDLYHHDLSHVHGLDVSAALAETPAVVDPSREARSHLRA